MEKLYKPLSLAIGALAIIFAFSSCDAGQTLSGNYNVYGSAVNVKSSSGLYSGIAGASVTLTNYYNASSNYATTLDSSGGFSFTGIPGGKYVMTGSSTSATFIPSFVTISGANTILPDLLAFPTSGATNTLTVVMTWENHNIDMDLSMTWGLPEPGTGVASPNHFTSGSLDNSGSGWKVIQNRSATGASTNLVEAITLTAVNSGPNDSFRFYANSNGTSNGTTGFLPSQEPAGVTVHVFKGTSHEGSFFAPYNTADTILRMCRIVIAGSTYSVYTDTQSDTVYRSLGGLQTVGTPVANFY